MLEMTSSILITKILPLLYAGIGFGVLITVHELGHFFACKLFGIGTPVFSIGFGPSLIKKQIGSTEFRLSLIPLGGYCAVQGMGEVEVIELQGAAPAANDESFETKPYWQKLIVILGGIACNLLFAYFAFTALHIGTRPKVKAELEITQVMKESAAAKYGIESAERLLGYNEVTFSSDTATIQEELKTFLSHIEKHPGEALNLTVRSKKGNSIVRQVILGGTTNSSGSLGVGLEIQHSNIPGETEHDSFSSALKKGVSMTNRWILQTATGIFQMFKKRSLGGIGGPIAMFSQTFKSAKTGWRNFLNFLAIISISLAVINVLPLGALDGGQLLFITLEFIFRRPLPLKLKESIIIASWVLFFGLILVLSYRDILRIFGY